MQRKPAITSVYFLIGLLLFQGLMPILGAQNTAPQQQGPPPPTAQELDQLLAPIALYPDALLAQITTASTNPQEILDVTNWLAKNPSLTGPALTEAAQKQGYDPAFIALVTFPRVLQMMADHIDEYAAIGQAVTANQADVADSVQRLRAQAYASGALRSNEQQKVEVQQVSNQPVYVIQPVNPVVVYVPQYNPTVVYVAPTTTVAPTSYITFGIGIGIGALVYSNQPWGWAGWGWGWGGSRAIYYNRGPWGGVWVGGYRPPAIWYHPRPPYYAHYPGYGGNWGYRPPNYRPPYANRPPAYRPPSHYPGNPGYRPGNPGYRPGNPGYRPGNPGYRPPVNGGRPIATPYKPSTRPAGNGNRPTTLPSNPNTRPAVSPPRGGTAPATRPQPQSRPAKEPGQRPVRQSRPATSNRRGPQQ